MTYRIVRYLGDHERLECDCRYAPLGAWKVGERDYAGTLWRILWLVWSHSGDLIEAVEALRALRPDLHPGPGDVAAAGFVAEVIAGEVTPHPVVDGHHHAPSI